MLMPPGHAMVTRAASTFPNLLALDRKWQQRWQEAAQKSVPTRQANTERSKKAYVLAMFPYPSGALHMGHLRVYTITDVLARFRHIQGQQVLYPMGWDSFGLPAENAAIERGIHPAAWTLQNTANMKSQLQAMNAGMDWSKEFMTSDPKFYQHTQRLFLLLYKHGLAYRSKAFVNYDPIDRTVLANEQVDANGYSWRSGAKVERIHLEQWFLRISAFRDALLNDLDSLGEQDRWPERVLAMQRHWIGKSEGAKIRFEVSDQARNDVPVQPVEVFTTRPDTLFGVQYLALSASHPLVKICAARDPTLAAFLDSMSTLPINSKLGYELQGLSATNPLCHITGTQSFLSETLPVFVAPYVLDEYGSGGVMGVPAHDTRDFAFWTQNRPGQTVRAVVLPKTQQTDDVDVPLTAPFTGQGYLTDICTPCKAMSSTEASKHIVQELHAAGGFASQAETWRLRDWLISRQRYWGCPIPIIHCTTCGPVPVPDSDLPVELPDVDGIWFKDRSGNPLEANAAWMNTSCPKCGSTARRDTDTMDTFVDSSWYFFRFADAHNDAQIFDPEKVKALLPVDIYVGGIEHAILHLLYARFISKFLASIGQWPSDKTSDVRGEPFTRLISQGMVHGKTFSDPRTGRFLKQDEIDLTDPVSPKVVRTGEKAMVSFEKMSKSKHNGVDPTSVISRHGADVTRVHVLFQAPVSDVLEWEEDRIVGIQRWFQRIWRAANRASHLIAESSALPKPNPAEYDSNGVALHNTLRATINSLTEALYRTFSLNTCVSDLMQLTNAIQRAETASTKSDESSLGVPPALYVDAVRTLVLLLAPFAPAFASECWELLHHSKNSTTAAAGESLDHIDVFSERFPTVESYPLLSSRSQTVAVMQNGKLRFAVDLPLPSEELLQKENGELLKSWLLEELRQNERGSKWLRDRKWQKMIVARGGKTINFVG